MLQLTPHMRILLAIEPLDFRKGLNSIVAYCKQGLELAPDSGTLFIFRNRAGIAVKIVCYDGVGYYLIYRRFSRGKLAWWPQRSDGQLHQLAAQQLAVLLAQGNPLNAAFPQDWRKIG